VPSFTGRVTVPVLLDKRAGTIVNNESSEIIRMFNAAFDACGAAPGDYYPEELRPEIDQLNTRIYDTLNNGVYKAGFATTQDAYEQAVTALFDTLSWLDALLGTRRFLCGDRLTEADWRLFTTLVRFDAVYVGHFKMQYSAPCRFSEPLGLHTRALPVCHIKRHYYQSHVTINPTRIVPLGPEINFELPPSRCLNKPADD
jgi:putative glutathione S-transferase